MVRIGSLLLHFSGDSNSATHDKQLLLTLPLFWLQTRLARQAGVADGNGTKNWRNVYYTQRAMHFTISALRAAAGWNV